jgi:hypothetical protein
VPAAYALGEEEGHAEKRAVDGDWSVDLRDPPVE